MESLIFLAVIVLIFLVLGIKGSLMERISDLSKRVDFLNHQLHQMNTEKHRETIREKFTKEETPKTEVEIKPKIVAESKVEIIKEERAKPELEKVIENVREVSRHELKESQKKPEPIEVKPIKQAKPTFFEKNPDLEKFIGENLINKIGIGILVLGIGFFVKYAISQNWINEIGRTAIGVLCGAILIGLAHRLRKTFAAFSSVLVGGGLAVLYFTITIAFHEYHIFSQTIAFIIMILITAFSVLLSISYDRKELAVLSLIGGFASPFMLSTGEGNYIALFTYITILNVGMLTLAYFKKWNSINIIAYIFTVLIYSGWLAFKVMGTKDGPYEGAFIFATIFYVLFFLMNIINNVKESRKFNAFEISILLSVTFLYYTDGMYLLNHLGNGQFNGLFTILVALFNFLFAFGLYKNAKTDKNLVYLLIGLVLTFSSLAAPIQLEGNHITMFWAAEAVLLLWLSQKSQILLIKKASVIVMALMLGSLLLDWKEIYFDHFVIEKLAVILNKGFLTGLIAVISLSLSLLFLKKEDQDTIFKGFKVQSYKRILEIILIVCIYTVTILELRYQLFVHQDYYGTREIISGSYNFFFLIVLNYLARSRKTPFFLEASVFLGFAAILVYPIFYHDLVIHTRNAYLTTDKVALSSYMIHYIQVIFVILLLVICYKNTLLKSFMKSELDRVIMWYVSGIVIFIASAELDNIMVISNYSFEMPIESILKQNHKIGFPILWGICSFILMVLGMRLKRRDLRVISLTLFLVIILKLFIYDIRGISEGGKIAAFIFLGVILLIVSFMYQKLKKLVLEDDRKSKTEVEE